MTSLPLPRTSLASLGLSAAAVDAMLSAFEDAGLELHSLMLARDGRVAADGWWSPYRPDRVHMLHSVTKALTATGVGLAVGEGLFGLDDRVASFFPDHLPADASDALRSMRVRDLLTQTTGHDRGTSGSVWRGIETSWIAEFFKIPVVHAPGAHFQYTSASSFMLSAIVTRCTGQSLHDYLSPRLFAPLGMTSVRWDVGPEGINPGGNGVSATSEDLLKLAVLHAADGVWQGRRILPEGWVAEAGRAAPGRPYGHHWWALPGVPGMLAFGAFGQYAFVLPEQNFALVTTAAIPGSISRPDVGIPPIVWAHLPRILAGADADSAAADRLAARLRHLSLPPVDGAPDVAVARLVDKVQYRAEPNVDGVDSIAVSFTGDRCRLEIAMHGGVHVIEAGLDGHRIEADTSLPGAALHHGYEPARLLASAAAAWTSADTLTIACQYVETAFRDTLRLRFGGAAVTLDRSVNVNGGATDRPTVRAWRTSV